VPGTSGPHGPSSFSFRTPGLAAVVRAQMNPAPLGLGTPHAIAIDARKHRGVVFHTVKHTFYFEKVVDVCGNLVKRSVACGGVRQREGTSSKRQRRRTTSDPPPCCEGG